jgi:hypothetical protein
MVPMTDTEPNKFNILKEALDARKQELLMYQINIDNYRAAIIKIEKEHADNEDLQAMRAELITRLADEEKQQLRSRIIYEVIREQLV